MASIHREFFMNFNQSSSLIVNFLPEAKSGFFSIDLLEIKRSPPAATGDMEPVDTMTGRKFLPLAELSFVF
jgi:hypothetical protein